MLVLYEDNHLLGVWKPAGALVQGGKAGVRSLQDEIKAWIAHKYNRPGNVYLGLVHRLDRSVSGVMVFARTSKAAARLSEQIRQRTTEKTYRAWVEGTLQDATFAHYLSEHDGYVKAHTAPGNARKMARLSYRVLQREETRTLVEIALETGRKHQIRVQFAHSGHPIVGDQRYGARTPWPEGIALMSYRMRFRHPTKDEELTLMAPPGHRFGA